MTFAEIEKRVFNQPILASDGNHSARLWRVAQNVRDHALEDASVDRLQHLMARVGVLCRGLARDLRNGHTSPEEVALLLDQLADIGDLSFAEWMRPA